MKQNRKFDGGPILVASHNPGKIKEISSLLTDHASKVTSARALKLIEPEETGRTFVKNANLKALAAAKSSGLPSLADDSGISIPFLDHRPGIYSARWAGPDRNFELAMEKILLLLKESGINDRRAYFTCALSLAWPDQHIETFTGKIWGSVTYDLRGDKGFGYDAIFQPTGFEETFGEMDPSYKHSISHRSIAFQKLVNSCFNT